MGCLGRAGWARVQQFRRAHTLSGPTRIGLCSPRPHREQLWRSAGGLGLFLKRPQSYERGKRSKSANNNESPTRPSTAGDAAKVIIPILIITGGGFLLFCGCCLAWLIGADDSYAGIG